MRRLKEDGLLATTDFQARRAFGVQEYEDEGLHYFLELSDGRVLFLSGQYLYEYEPCEDDPENREPRRFPCTDFTILRHKVEGHVMELICRGTVLEPEFIALPFPKQQAWSEDIPEGSRYGICSMKSVVESWMGFWSRCVRGTARSAATGWCCCGRFSILWV